MSRAVVVIRNSADRERVIKWANNVKEGTVVEFRSARRSLDQNSLMWGRLWDISRQVVWYGEKLSAEDWKDILTASLRKARVVPGIDDGTLVPLGMRTSDMTVSEMSDLLDLIAAFGAQHSVMFSDERENANVR